MGIVEIAKDKIVKTRHEMAQARVKVKRNLAKGLHTMPQNETQAEAVELIDLAQELDIDTPLIENLYRIAFKFNNKAEYTNSSTDRQPLIEARDMLLATVSWLKYDKEGKALVSLWNEQIN